MEEKSNVFVADIFSISKTLDTSMITTAGQFIVLSNVVRPLIKLNSQAQIEGDLVESWEISEDSTLFQFTISKGAKWSNGELITSDDVIKSLERQRSLNTANHFHFSSIKSLTKINPTQFTVKLLSLIHI